MKKVINYILIILIASGLLYILLWSNGMPKENPLSYSIIFISSFLLFILNHKWENRNPKKSIKID